MSFLLLLDAVQENTDAVQRASVSQLSEIQAGRG